MRRLLLGAALLAGCGATPLEQAKTQWGKAAVARARGDATAEAAALNGVVAAADRDTRKTLDAESAQLNLLRALAWADLAAAGVPKLGDKRLGALSAARPSALPAAKRPVRLAAQCRWAADRGLRAYAALCWDALLEQVPHADDPSVRRAAVQGLIRASEGPGTTWSALVVATQRSDPHLARLLAALRADPLDMDAVTLVAVSLRNHCGQPGFEPEGAPGEPTLADWRRAQADLLDAAIAFDGFTDHDLRCTARAERAEAHRVPLCGAEGDPQPKGARPPLPTPQFWRACAADASAGGRREASTNP